MKVNFNTLKSEAMEGIESEPFILSLPGKQKDLVIEQIPVGLFLATFDSGDKDPTVGMVWNFLEAVVPTKDWERVSGFMRDQPLPVLAALVEKIAEHFKIVFSNLPKESEDSDE